MTTAITDWGDRKFKSITVVDAFGNVQGGIDATGKITGNLAATAGVDSVNAQMGTVTVVGGTGATVTAASGTITVTGSYVAGNGLQIGGATISTMSGSDFRGPGGQNNTIMGLATVGASNKVFLIGGGQTITSYTSGTIIYTINWTDLNGNVQTISASQAALGSTQLAPIVDWVKATSTITANESGTIVGTVAVASYALQLN